LFGEIFVCFVVQRKAVSRCACHRSPRRVPTGNGSRDLCESHWSAGILPAWGAISPEKRRLEASAPVVVRPFAEVSSRVQSAKFQLGEFSEPV
jgi:hypothetical protein